MSCLDGTVREHFQVVHSFHQLVFVVQRLQRLVHFTLPHSVGFEVRNMVGMGREIEGASALIDQHILEVRIHQCVGLFQMSHQAIGLFCSHLVLQRPGIVVTIAGIHIFYPNL